MFDVDKAIADLKYVRRYEDKTGFCYMSAEKEVKMYIGYDGEPRLKAYDKEFPDYANKGYLAVGLTEKELILFRKKIAQWRKQYEVSK